MERAHVNMIGKYDTSGVCHHCGEVSFLYSFISQNGFFFVYRKVAGSNTSRLEAHAGFFRLLMTRDSVVPINISKLQVDLSNFEADRKS